MKRVAIGLLGPVLDQGRGPDRWNRWRPTVGLCQQEDLPFDRLDLIYQRNFTKLADLLVQDISTASPETEVRLHVIDMKDPWDFEEVYSGLFDFAKNYKFDTDEEEYYVHITTGSHVAQICLFLLTESRHFPAKLVQTSPPRDRGREGSSGSNVVIDLDLSRYDAIATRFEKEIADDISFLKCGIETKNRQFNKLIERIEQVALRSVEPILLMGPTGSGKSRLARRLYDLKKARGLLKEKAPFVEVNCATLRGDTSLSTLFGHKKGSYTGATQDRDGLLLSAHNGMLFLDEIGELGLDEQALLLRAIEEKRFLPMGADKEVESCFQLVCGTNRELRDAVMQGRFREDLLVRIQLWTFRLPGLRERAEDIEPNLDFELDSFAKRSGRRVTFNKEARKRFLDFALSGEAAWEANFRDLNSSVVRMATLAPGGRITTEIVDDEISRLQVMWNRGGERYAGINNELVKQLIEPDELDKVDLFDRMQLGFVLSACKDSRSLSEAGRKLFAASRTKKATANDADRLRKYLARFGVTWDKIADIPR
ncbi:MAG: RNA repair transcriptional activator RtcR [Victivallales bacterium]